MKRLLLMLCLLAASWPAAAIESDLDQRYRTGRAMQYWGLGGGVMGGATAIPITAETLRFLESLRSSRNPVEACVKGVIAVIVLPPLLAATGAVWAGGVAGTGVGLGGSLMARRALVDAGGRVTPAPAIAGITALTVTPALIILGLTEEDEALIFAGIGTFAGANALLLTQSLLNGAEYRQLSTLSQTGQDGTRRNIVIPPITIGGRF